MIVQSVNLRTYLYLEAIYLAADDESKDEEDALALMDIVWNFLTTEEHAFLDSRTKIGEQDDGVDEGKGRDPGRA